MGLSLTRTGETTASASWWAEAGKTYFLLGSTDLVQWHYLNLIEQYFGTGSGEMKAYGFEVLGSKFFLRVRSTTLTATDRYAADFDGDGLPNGWEVSYGLDPLASNAGADSDQDGVSDWIEYLQGRNPSIGAVADATGAVALSVFTRLE